MPKYYWDACIWIELIKQTNADRTECCRHVYEEAKKSKVEIWTSTFTLAEVWKKKCYENHIGIPEKKDGAFEDLIESDLIKKINVNVDIGNLARRLLRKHPRIGKPQDAIHVASCIYADLDELHTFDNKDLLRFDGKLLCQNNTKLKICVPPSPMQRELNI
ncbi:MAG: PIN domain-containing protein [Gammaproteobacteria bacterium]|nr:PIN domain-containing protein [Gammaproteobacteria bacterium]